MRLFEHLFSGIKLGSLELKNRIVMAPMATGFFENGQVTSQAREFYLARARGGVGLTIVGGVYITWPDSADTSSIGRHAHLKDDSVIKGWQDLIKELHQFGAKVGVQIFHPGRQVNSFQWGEQPVGPSSVPSPGIKDVPRELAAEEIEELVELFSNAAKRAESAGFDLIELHGAHGYLISSFMSPHSNRRGDFYGGSLENRARFPVQNIKRIRQRVNSSIPLGIRMNGQDNVEGGITLKEARSFASVFEKSGIDFLDISSGFYGSYPSLAPIVEPQGCFIPLAEGIKKVVQVPVIGVGRIKDPHYADQLIEQGKVDLVALGRTLIADPEWPKKVVNGELDSIRKCISCNQGCLDKIEEINFYGRSVSITCLLNPWVGREKGMPPVKAVNSKRIMVIGGGPAGLAFSSVAAQRGHQVTVIEKEQELGGQFRLAAVPPTKQDIKVAINYMTSEAEQTGVIIKKGQAYNRNLLKDFSPRVVIVATGARPLIPNIPGVKRDIVVTAQDTLSGRAKVGARVLIIGGGLVGLETADYLSSQGRIVQVLEMKKRFGIDMGSVAAVSLLRRLESMGVELIKLFEVKEIFGSGVKGVHRGIPEKIEDIDNIVLAVGAVSQNALVEEMKDYTPEVYMIGDATRPRNALTAIHEGYRLAGSI